MKNIVYLALVMVASFCLLSCGPVGQSTAYQINYQDDKWSIQQVADNGQVIKEYDNLSNLENGYDSIIIDYLIWSEVQKNNCTAFKIYQDAKVLRVDFSSTSKVLASFEFNK